MSSPNRQSIVVANQPGGAGKTDVSGSVASDLAGAARRFVAVDQDNGPRVLALCEASGHHKPVCVYVHPAVGAARYAAIASEVFHAK